MNCWNVLKLSYHNRAGNGRCDGFEKLTGMISRYKLHISLCSRVRSNMDNQQLSTLTMEERIKFLAIESRLGDGQLWKHPECRNYKLIMTSTSPELLEAKQRICPCIFKTGVRFFETKHHSGRYANSKPMYRLASVVHPLITEVKQYTNAELLSQLTVDLLGLWFLDDGSTVKRIELKTEGYRFTLYLGRVVADVEDERVFWDRIHTLFSDITITTKTYGTIRQNTSRYGHPENNKKWAIPYPIARVILRSARQHNALLYKCPDSFIAGESSETKRVQVNSSAISEYDEKR